MSPFFHNKPVEDALRERRQGRAMQYNSIRWLNETYLENLIERGKLGDFWELQWLYAEIEERFEVLSTVIDRRLAALRKLSWNVKPLDGGDSLLHKMMVEEGKAFFNGIANLEDAVAHQCLAKFRGFAHLQIMTDAVGNVTALDCTPQWHFKKVGGDWFVRNSPGGQLFPVTSDSFVSRECSRPIDPAAARRFVKASLAEADYSATVEDAGIFALFMEMPANVSPENKAEFEKQAELAITGMRGIIPHSSKPHFVGNTNGGSLNIFEDYLDRQTSSVVLQATGGKLTVLAEAGGLGNGAANVHDAAFDDLALADAQEISQLFTRQLLEPWLRAQFPGSEPMAYFEIAAKDTDDLDAEAKRLQTLNSAGHKAKSSWVAEKFGVELETPNDGQGQPPVTPSTVTPAAAPVANADKANATDPLPTREEATQALLSALGADMTPAFEAVVALTNKETLAEEDFLNLLELMESSGGEKSEDAFNQFYSAAMLNGWVGNPEE